MSNKPLEPVVVDVNSYNASSNPVPTVKKKLEYTDAEKQYHFDVLQMVRNGRAERERPPKKSSGFRFRYDSTDADPRLLL